MEGVQKRVPCEVYSRVVGYLRPVRQWNQAKQDEFHARLEYVAPTAPVLEAMATPEACACA